MEIQYLVKIYKFHLVRKGERGEEAFFLLKFLGLENLMFSNSKHKLIDQDFKIETFTLEEGGVQGGC